MPDRAGPLAQPDNATLAGLTDSFRKGRDGGGPSAGFRARATRNEDPSSSISKKYTLLSLLENISGNPSESPSPLTRAAESTSTTPIPDLHFVWSRNGSTRHTCRSSTEGNHIHSETRRAVERRLVPYVTATSGGPCPAALSPAGSNPPHQTNALRRDPCLHPMSVISPRHSRNLRPAPWTAGSTATALIS